MQVSHLAHKFHTHIYIRERVCMYIRENTTYALHAHSGV